MRTVNKINFIYLHTILRPLISILLLIILSLGFSIRLIGYLHCTIKIYIVTHTSHSINSFEYCECLRYLAYAADEDSPQDQLHKAPQTTQQQDYVTDKLPPMMTAILLATTHTFRPIRELYAYRDAQVFFHPPRSISSC